MKALKFFLAIIFFSSTSLLAQQSDAILDLESNSQGVLFPRMTTAERDDIVQPSIGLQIYNLDDHCIDLYNGTSWMQNCASMATDSIPLDLWEYHGYSGTPGTFEVTDKAVLLEETFFFKPRISKFIFLEVQSYNKKPCKYFVAIWPEH